MNIQVSDGEALDRLSILAIKKAHITDPKKLANVEAEFSLLTWLCEPLLRSDEVKVRVLTLAKVNRELWDVEDKLRALEAEQRFDEYFIELARSVYKLNDERAAIKREINALTNSAIVEEKQYTEY